MSPLRWILPLNMCLFFILGSLQGIRFAQAQDSAADFSDEQRLKGFAEHNRANRNFERARESEVDSVKQEKMEWDEHLQEAVKEYKDWKSRQARSLDEKSPEYWAEKKKQRQLIKEHEDIEADYARERHRRLAKRKSNVLLTEEQEYHLDEVGVRTDIKNRPLYGGKAPWLKSSDSSMTGKRAGSPGSPDYSAPPATPPSSGPELYEPEIPPPPPPPDPGVFDESIPPPMFEDPEF